MEYQIELSNFWIFNNTLRPFAIDELSNQQILEYFEINSAKTNDEFSKRIASVSVMKRDSEIPEKIKMIIVFKAHSYRWIYWQKKWDC